MHTLLLILILFCSLLSFGDPYLLTRWKKNVLLLSYDDDYHQASDRTSSSLNLQDPITTFSPLERFLFHRFSLSVAKEMNLGKTPPPSSYKELLDCINSLSFGHDSTQKLNDRSKSILVNLFPPGLLIAYKASFGRYLPTFSAWMNTWVTYWTTQWLMGPSRVLDLDVDQPEGNTITKKENLLLVEKCRFLETSGCIRTCVHACKIPTQRFFWEEMALPVALKPNLTDYSCRFEFGVIPVPLEEDESLHHSGCLTNCTRDVVHKNSRCWE